MHFPGDSATSTRARDLNARSIAAPCYYDWDIMVKYDFVVQLDRQLFHVYDNGFCDDELLKLFRIEQNVYKELVVEFLASFTFESGFIGKNFNTRKDRKSTRLNSSHSGESRMPSSA